MTHGAAIGPTHPLVLALRAERERQGLSRKEVCRRAHMAEGQISRIEAGHVSPTLSTLSAWARVLGMRLMTLSDGEAARLEQERRESGDWDD